MEMKPREEVENSGIIDTWMTKHRLLFTGATRHPFVLSIRDGTVDLSAFKTWLEQDYIFVKAFSPFAASVVMKASKESDDSSDMEVIMSVMSSQKADMRLKSEIVKWGVQPSDIVPQKANLDYCSLLGHRSCLSSKLCPLPGGWLQDPCRTEGDLPKDGAMTDFSQYCNSLQKIASRRLEIASDDVLTKAEVALLRVLEHEVEFWNMSRGGPDQPQLQKPHMISELVVLD
uniref:Thiaminase-2/PQQC domain-containing protein n=1 Tax=Fagus sylvatica TaxID=28930 RepID=A0A2N9HFG2_FAGSY